MAALFYQIIWVRLLSTFFGNTTLALALCLTAFMAGLALGSYALGRWAVKCRYPFRLYASARIGIGVYGVISPHLINVVRAGYLSLAADRPLDSPTLAAFQFSSCFFVLLIPTALMGGTLPVLIRGVVQRLEETGRDLAWLYGINTFGAAAGALLVGFFLLPRIGLQDSLFLAAGLNLAAGLGVLLLRQRGHRRVAGGGEGGGARRGFRALSADAHAAHRRVRPLGLFRLGVGGGVGARGGAARGHFDLRVLGPCSSRC